MFLTNLFNGIDRQYLIKSYIISVICTFLLWQSQSNHSLWLIMICGVNLILFPFATVVWDDLISLITGGMVVILPLPFMLIWKVLKIALLYMFTIFIAPIGIIYILLANKLRNKEE